ncbi:MAG: hypothetical protein QNL12_15255 [Acidimicrobiia bacterium]|nr:hypothetical protein [Acidimicrobiia bacterium]MDX2468672.1 hypothetical protein [Acidimicrobiia bacterium]
MHKHDQEIIMALAEETLDEAAATAALAEISGCTECTEDLELQRLALSVLAEAPAVYMSATESAQLHSDLRSKLGVPTRSPAPRRATVAWGRWVSVAAGTAAMFLVIFMVVPNILGGSDSDSAAVTTAAASAAANEESAAMDTTTASAEMVPQDREDILAGGLADDSAEYAASTETTAAPMAATTTTMAATESTDSAIGLADILPVIGFGDLTEEIRQKVIDEFIADGADLRLRDQLAKTVTIDAGECFTQLAIDLGIPPTSEAIATGLLHGDDSRERIVVTYLMDDVNEIILVVVDYPECEVVQTIPVLILPDIPQG